MNQPALRFTPWPNLGKLDFAHSFDDGLPEITERGKRFDGDDRFVQHLPDDRQLHECAGAALARHKSVGEADQLKEAVLPGGDADFDIDPRSSLWRRKTRQSHRRSFLRLLLRLAKRRPSLRRSRPCTLRIRVPPGVPESARFFIVGSPCRGRELPNTVMILSLDIAI